MKSKIKEIVVRIAGLRKLLDFSTSEMANWTGVSEKEYMQIENGDKSFSFTFLYKCAEIFGIHITELISGEHQRLKYYQVTRVGAGLEMEKKAEFTYSHLASMVKHDESEPFVVTAKYNESLVNANIATTSHDGEEFDYVLKGKLKVQIGDFVEILNEGDSIYYHSSKEHGMVAVGGEDCQFIAVVMGHNRNVTSSIETPIQSEDIPKIHRAMTKPVYERFLTPLEDAGGSLVSLDIHPNQNFNFAYDVVDYLGEIKPNKLAMLWYSNEMVEKRFSFRDMSEMSSKTANYFKSLGIKKGDKVMLIMKRHYQFWFSILALHKLGAIAVPATHLLTKHDLEYRFKAGDISGIVCTGEDGVAEQVDLALPVSPKVTTKIMVHGARKGWLDFDSNIEKQSPIFDRPQGEEGSDIDDPMLMYFTSGTTGYPNATLHAYGYPLAHFATAKYWQNVDPEGVHLSISDSGWAKAAWGKIYGQWLCEAAILTYDFNSFDVDSLLKLFAKAKITTFCAPPTIYRFFIKEDLSKYDFSSLKYAVTAGEALNPEVFAQFKKATGITLMEGFGQTETTLTLATLYGMTPKPGAMGKPTPQYDIDLINAEGETTRDGEVGEIVIRTDRTTFGLFLGYYGDEKKTNESWHNGIYYTGDTAWRDEDGYFWFVGRTDDIIKSSGYRIGPFEIESVLMELPYVLECAIYGVPDPIRGQVVKATIVLTKDKIGNDELVKEIQNYVKVNTAPYKYPRIIDFVDSLPKTISGKIRRVELRK